MPRNKKATPRVQPKRNKPKRLQDFITDDASQVSNMDSNVLPLDGASATASQSTAHADGGSQGELSKVLGALKSMEDRLFALENVHARTPAHSPTKEASHPILPSTQASMNTSPPGIATALQPTFDPGNLCHLRANPSLTAQVAQLMASYEAQSSQELIPGKPGRLKTGRFSSTENMALPPEIKWPNENFVNTGARKLGFDDLSLPQFTVGHLNNCLQTKDPNTLRHMLIQLRDAHMDATVLPWPVVRGAWAQSMSAV